MALNGWTDEELLALARERGVEGADGMSREQLLRELEPAKPQKRLDIARALLSRVVDRVRDGLSTRLGTTPPPVAPSDDVARDAGEPILTRTLAGLLVDQGHDERALGIYEHLVDRAPHDAELAAEASAVRGRVAERRTDGHDDEVVAVAVEGGSLLVSWQVGEDGIARARTLLGESGRLAARVVVLSPDDDSVVRSDLREKTPVSARGEWLIGAVPSLSRCAVSIGLLDGERFVSVAHARVVRAG